MSIRKGIYDLLKAIEADVYPLVAPQELTVPYVVYSIRKSPVRTQDGIGVTDIDLTLYIYANSASECFDLTNTMFAGMEGATGTYDGETLMIANWVADEPGIYIDDLKKYEVAQEYQLRFT